MSLCREDKGYQKGVYGIRDFETGLYWQYTYFYYNIRSKSTSGLNRYTFLSFVGCYYHQIHTFKPYIGFYSPNFQTKPCSV
jgi:hypothetical protein